MIDWSPHAFVVQIKNVHVCDKKLSVLLPSVIGGAVGPESNVENHNVESNTMLPSRCSEMVQSSEGAIKTSCYCCSCLGA